MRIVTCSVGLVLAALAVAGCGDAVPAPTTQTGSAEPAASSEAAPATLAPPAPTATDAPAEATETATGLGYGTPRPRPVVDADDCAQRWNAATNAALRAEVAGVARGASVGLEYDGEPRCLIGLTAVAAPDPAGRVVYYAEFAAGVYRSPGGASGVGVAAERPVDRDGWIGETIARPSPPPTPPLPEETGLPVGTVGGVGVADGVPPPAPVGDTDGCADRWNDDRNAAARGEVAGRARGAFVRLRYDGQPRCTVLLALRAAGGVGGGLFYAEVADREFREVGGTGAITAPAERGVDADGRVGPLRSGGPPAAAIEGVATLGVGTHCWEGSCVDVAPPACGDGTTPSALLQAGVPIRFLLGVEPEQPPVLTVLGPDAPVETTLPAAGVIDWIVALRPDRHAATLTVAAAAGEVTYTVCLEVEEPHPSALPGVPLSHLSPRVFGGVDVTRPDRSEPDAAECARRWNGPANAGTRAETVAAAAPAAALVGEQLGDAPWCLVYLSYAGSPRERVQVYKQNRAGRAFASTGDGWGLREAPGWRVGADGRLTPLSLPAEVGVASDDGLVTAGAGAGTCGDGRTPWLSAPGGGVVQLSLYQAPQASPVAIVRQAGATVSTTTLDVADTVIWRPALEPGWYDVELAVQPAGGPPATYAVCLAVRP